MKLHSTNQILNLNEVDKSNIETPDEEVECYLGIKRKAQDHHIPSLLVAGKHGSQRSCASN